MNSSQLEQLEGVTYVTGSVIIAPDLGPVPQLACLEEASFLALNSGNDYSAMTGFRKAEEINLVNSASTTLPNLLNLESVTNMVLSNVDTVLEIPNVHSVVWLQLYDSNAPSFSGDLSVTQLTISGDQSNFDSLDGLTLTALEVSTFLGTELPQVTVTRLLTINNAPNMEFMLIEFGDTFPVDPANDASEAMMAGLSISYSGLVNLDGLANIMTYTAIPTFTNNESLVDISALAGRAVDLSYSIPDVYPSGIISGSPNLCKSSAQEIVDSMELPTFFELSQINNGC